MLTRHFPMRFVAIVVFFAALWFILWRQLSGEWSVNDQYSYGWFVPFFAIVLFWLRYEDAPQPRALSEEQGARSEEDTGQLPTSKATASQGGQRTEVTGQETNNRERITNNSKARVIAIVIAMVALLLLLPIRLFEIGNPDWRPLSWLHAICVVAITFIFLWSIGGRPW